MKNIIKIASAVAVSVALAQSIQATPITGSIGFSGVGVVWASGATSAGTATGISTWLAPVVSGVSGVFQAPAPFAVANGTPATFAAGTWNFNTVATINNFWSVGGFTFQLLASSITSQGGVPGSTGFVVVNGVGTVTGNGYEATTLTWSFTAQDPASGANPTSWSFSASANSRVPDGGATVMLLGIALSGVALLRKKLTA